MQIILLEKIANLGNLGDVVKVKDGYARNFLIPTKRARRATEAAIKSSRRAVPTWKRRLPRSSPPPGRCRSSWAGGAHQPEGRCRRTAVRFGHQRRCRRGPDPVGLRHRQGAGAHAAAR